MGEWRLFHNPENVYFDGSLPSDYPIIGQPQPYKYIPNFLLFFAPFMALSYQNALHAFDILQVLLIPLLGFFVYRLVEDKNLFLAAAVALIVILDPILIAPSISYDMVNFLHYRAYSLQVQTFSPSYLCGYTLANAHILQTVLLVGALYFGFIKKPKASALLLVLGAFDPRSVLFVLPLLLWYNRHSIWRFIGWTAILLAITNLPFFLYGGVGFAFLNSVFSGEVVFQMYLYDWIPIYAAAALTIAEVITILHNRRNANYLKLKNQSVTPIPR
jgi:hypothetical protein